MINLSNTTLAFLLTIAAGLSTMIGCIPIFFRKISPNKIIPAALAFASGVMITVSITDLLPESYQEFSLLSTIPRLLLIAIFFVVGVIFSMLIDKYFPDQIEETNKKGLYRIGAITMIAIILHNIPEGIATFMVTSSDTRLGISLALAIALHNIPEGISISIPIYYATKNKKRALLYTFISGISEPFGALLTYLFLRNFITSTVMGCLFAIIAGIMTHIACYELLPTAKKYKKRKILLAFFLLGSFVMIINALL